MTNETTRAAAVREFGASAYRLACQAEPASHGAPSRTALNRAMDQVALLKRQESKPRPSRPRPTSQEPPRAVSPIGRFAHLRPAPGASISDTLTSGDPPSAASSFAQDVLETTARARGEKFDRKSMVRGPDQTRTPVTGDDLVRALKQSGRAAKPGEGH